MVTFRVTRRGDITEFNDPIRFVLMTNYSDN